MNLRHEFAVRQRFLVGIGRLSVLMLMRRAAALATIRLALLLTEYGRKRRGGR